MFIENMIKMGIYDPDWVEQICINEFYKHTIPSGLPRFRTVVAWMSVEEVKMPADAFILPIEVVRMGIEGAWMTVEAFLSR